MYCFGRKLHRGWVYSNYYFYIRRLRLFFGVLNFEFQYFRGFSEKRIFLGYEDFVDIFLG